MTRRYRFLLSPTWLGWLGLCTLFALACVFLAQWQIDRRDQALEEIGRVVSNYDEDPVSYSEVRELFHDPSADDEWTVTRVTGEYLEDETRLVRNRAHAGSIGYEQLVPFSVAGTDDVVVVSRGWLPTDSADGSRPAYMPQPPEGEVEMVMRLKPGEPEIDRDAPAGQLASVDLDEYATEVDRDLVLGAYGQMASEDPAPEETPQQLARPELDEGPHLSYSMQWYAFGLLGFVGWGYAARVQARHDELSDEEDDLDDGRHRAAGVPRQERLREARRRQRLRSGRLTDEDVEDAWTEEHLLRR
ncbi:MAG: SURF1 family protein [Nesterenkonia sp.]|uniref:SURF1 family cytochrome oxidase biogenesis protein n=1 Tax=Nesterenkonia marinintestina TaxID=2979865 RepID=UPI0021C14918|nr:SURF1 family protein [Nesterenkonia sp. GX14115]MDO5492523.1 SURF1 family protein [Nesterenkonia sp.]